MKFKKPILLALSIGLGLTCVAPALAAKDGDVKVENQQTLTRGDGGYWVENTSKTFRFMDLVRKAVVDALTAALGHAPSAAEIDAMLALHNSAPSVDWAVLAKAQVLIAQGGAAASNALAQVKALEALAQQNKNSKYPNNLPAAFLQSSGAISNQVALQVGAFGGGIGADTKIRNAYLSLGIDPSSKKMPNGQTLSGDFTTMIKQLQDSGMITMDWNFDSLMNDLGRQNIVNMANARNGVSGGWGGNQQNLFSKANLHDATLQHDWNAGINGAYADDYTVRSWISTYDGIGSFNNRGDVDLYQAVTYSTAAKLVAESKALLALGMTAEANAKLVAARNLVLLTGNNHDPLVLDLNGNGKVDVTGLSSAKYRSNENRKFVQAGSVKFDLLANGQPVITEWIKGGDGFLVDNRKNAAMATLMANKPFTGANLFGDVEGFPGGFMKLGTNFDKEAKFASDMKIRLSANYGVLKGEELNDLMIWIDDGDGVAKPGELKTLSELGITEISVMPKWVTDKKKGETFEQSYFIRNGKKHLIQEVWFMGK